MLAVDIKTSAQMGSVTVNDGTLALFAEKTTSAYLLKAKGKDGQIYDLSISTELLDLRYASAESTQKALQGKADKTTMDKQLAKKANASDVYTKTEADKEFKTSCFVIVANIAERDEVADHTKLVQVEDASNDPTVNKGSATYYWSAKINGWRKMAEAESMDLEELFYSMTHFHTNGLSEEEATELIAAAASGDQAAKARLKAVHAAGLALLNSYTESNDDIRSAISMRHQHTNKEIIDQFGEDENGRPTYKGENLQAIVDAGRFMESVTYAFQYYQSQPEIQFNLTGLNLEPLTIISVWQVQADNSEEQIHPNIWYTSANNGDRLLVIDMGNSAEGDITFEEGTYRMRFIRLLQPNNETIVTGKKEFNLETGTTSYRFTFEDLGLTQRTDITVWQRTPEGNDEQVNANIKWDATDELVVDLTGFSPGLYTLSYYRITAQ